MRERKYNRYRKEKRLALTILGVLVAAVLAFVLVFSLTAKKDGNPLSSLTPEMNGSLDMNTGSSVSSTDKSDIAYAVNSGVSAPANSVLEVGSVPDNYSASGTEIFTASKYTSDFHGNTGGNLTTNYKMTTDVDIDGANFGSRAVYAGTFDGAGHTIRLNFGTNTSVSFTSTTSQAVAQYRSNFYSMGFLGRSLGYEDASGGVIKNLKIVITGNLTVNSNSSLSKNGAMFGMIAGWVRGRVENVSIEIAEGASVTFNNQETGENKDAAFGLFAGVAGNDSDSGNGKIGKFYNVQSIINGTLKLNTNSGNAHVGFGGIVGQATHIEMYGAILSGSGTIQMSGTGGWRMAGGFIGMGRQGFGDSSHPNTLKAPTNNRLKINNLVLKYTGAWNAPSNGERDNSLCAFVGSFGSYEPSSAIKVYTPYNCNSASNINKKAGSNSDPTNTSDTTTVFATFQSSMDNPFTHVNVQSDKSELKLLYTLGATSAKPIAVPTDAVGFKPKGVDGSDNLGSTAFDSEHCYLDLSSGTGQTYNIIWLKDAPPIAVTVPTYSTGWLTDFGKIPYGYKGIPNDATAIANQTQLQNWVNDTSSNYGYLTGDFSLSTSGRQSLTLGKDKVLDGAGHTITLFAQSGWVVRTDSVQTTLYGRTTRMSGGLFPYNEGTIKNLTVKLPNNATNESNTGGSNGNSLLNGLVVGINKPTGRIENVTVFNPSGTNFQFHCNATESTMYNILGGVVGVNEGYVGYSSITNNGVLNINTGANAYTATSSAGSKQISILGGVIGVNFGAAEYLTSYGNNTGDGLIIGSNSGTKYLGSVIGVSCLTDDGIFTVNNTKVFNSSDSRTVSLNYVFSGYTGNLKSTYANARAGSVAGYISGTTKGIFWAITSGNSVSYSMVGSVGTVSRKASEGAGIGSGSATGGNIRASKSEAGAIHGYFDYFYNDGALHLEFENAADISSVSNNSGSNVTVLSNLREFEISKAGLDVNNNVVVTTEIYSPAALPADPYNSNNLASDANHKAWVESIALAGRADGANNNYSPNYVSGTTSGSTITSLPLSGSTTYYLTNDVDIYMDSKTNVEQNNSNGSGLWYSGTLDGNGHTLNIYLRDASRCHWHVQRTDIDTDKDGWIGVAGILTNMMNGATIKNLHIKFYGNLTFSSDSYNYGYYGLLAGVTLGATKITNCTIEFSTGTITMNKTSGDCCFFGGLFGMMGGTTIVENSVIVGNGTLKLNKSPSKTSVMGLLAARVDTTTTSSGYQNVILTGTMTSENAAGNDRISTVFGMKAGWLPGSGNGYYYKRKNVIFYRSTFTLKGDRTSLFAESQSSNTGNNTSYVGIRFTSDSSSCYQGTTQYTNMARYHHWSGGDISGSTASTLTADSYSSDNASSYLIKNLNGAVIDVLAWQTQVETVKSNIKEYNDTRNEAPKLSASVTVDGKTYSSNNYSTNNNMYLSYGKQLYSSSGNYAYRGFIRYGLQTSDNDSKLARYNASRSTSFISTNLSSGISITLKAQLSVVGYAEQSYGNKLSEAESYATVYAKFNKIMLAYENSADKDYFKALLERSAGINGVGKLTVGLPSTSFGLTEDEKDRTAGSGVNWLKERISVSEDTSKAAYIFRAHSGAYRLDVTASFISLKGLITEFDENDTLFYDTELPETVTRTVSDGDEDAIAKKKALLYGISDGNAVYFGQSSDAKSITIHTNTKDLYDDLSAAKTGLTSTEGARNGWFTISGVGDKLTHETSSGTKDYVNLPNCDYAVIVNDGLVTYDNGTITVGSTAKSTVAMHREQIPYSSFNFRGDVADNSNADGWKTFSVKTSVEGSYVPGRTETVQNVKLYYNNWDDTSYATLTSAAPAPGTTKTYHFSDFGVGNGAGQTLNFGKYVRLKAENLDEKTLEITIKKIDIGENDVVISPSDNGGNVISKVYDGYPTDKLTGVKLFTGATVDVKDDIVHSNFKNALKSEVLGTDAAQKYTLSQAFQSASDSTKNYTASDILDAGSYKYSTNFRLTATNNNYNVDSKLTAASGITVNVRDNNNRDVFFTVYPLPLSFTYTANRTNLSETFTGQRIDFMSAKASLSSAAEELIRGQYTDNDGYQNAAVEAVNNIISAINGADSDHSQIGIRYLYAADASGDVNTMFDDDSRFGATYASSTRTVGGKTVVDKSGPINAGTYYFSGYIVGNTNFIGLTNDYKELWEALGWVFNEGYFEDMADGLKGFSSGWAIELAANNGYADAFNFADYAGSSNISEAFSHYYGMLTHFAGNDGLFESSAKDVRTVSISRSTVSVYVKDSAIEYGSVDPYVPGSKVGPEVDADYVITNTSISTAVTVRINPEAFTIDGETYRYLPVKLADPTNLESSVTAYRNALYIDTDIKTGNPNLIISAVGGNLTVVRREVKVSWAYDESDSTYNRGDNNNGVYEYAAGVKHTMVPTYSGIINNDLLDFDIIGDGDMESVGVHKIIVAFSSRYPLDSYNYYLGESATGYFTVSPITVNVDFRYYSNSSKNSWNTNTYQSHGSSQTLYGAIIITVNGKEYYTTSTGTNAYWRTISDANDRLDLDQYPAYKWLETIKDNLTWSSPNKVTPKDNWTWTGSQCSFTLSAADAGSSYTFTVEMNGFNYGNYNLDMHSVRSVFIYNSANNKTSYNYYYHYDGSYDNFKRRTTGTTISMNTTPADVRPNSGIYYNGGDISTNAVSNSSVYDFQKTDYVNIGYLFDCGDPEANFRDRNVNSVTGDYYRGLFYAPNNTQSVLNRDDSHPDWSRYNGFESIIYSLRDYSPWDYNQYPASFMALFFNVNIDNPMTAAIAKNGGINVSIGGVAVTAGQESVYIGNTLYAEYGAAALTAEIELNDRGTDANTAKSLVTRTEAKNYVNTYPNSASLASLLYKKSDTRENIMYSGRIDERYLYNAPLGDYTNMQSLIYASNATEPTVNNSSNAINGRDLTRKTLISSVGKTSDTPLKGDSFRINLYATSRNTDWSQVHNTKYRGIMAQFGKLQVVLSKSDLTAPKVEAPVKQGNGYRFKVTDNIGVDTASISLMLADNRMLTVANGGLKVVSKTFDGQLLKEVIFETTTCDNGYAVGADRTVINQIVSVTARDITYGGGYNEATYGFNANGNWVEETKYTTLSAKNTGFVDTVGPAINITHVGLENYADGDSRWEIFTADNSDEQKRAKKFITATWRQQNYLWLKFSAGSGKIPSDEALSRIAVYDNGDFTVTPIFEQTYTSNYPSIYNVPAIRLEANTRYYLVAEDRYGNRSEVTLYFSMVDTADAAALSIVADPVELDDNNLIEYTGGSAIVDGGAASAWSPLVAEKLFANPANPRFGLDMESDGVYNYSVMLVRLSDGIRVAVRSFVDGKITYICGTQTFDSESLSHEYNAVTGTGEISHWLRDSKMGKLEINNAQTVRLFGENGELLAEALKPMVINTEDYNSYLEDTWSNSSVIMRLVGSGESNSLARFYYRYAPISPDTPNSAINENVTSNAHLFRNYGWMALPVTVDDNGNVIVDQANSLLFEHTGIYRFEVKIELGAGQNSYLVYRDSFGNWVYNAYAEGGNIRAYKVDQSHFTKYDPYNTNNPKGGAEFKEATEIGYYTVKIDKRIYFLEFKNYWYSEENEYDSETKVDNRLENYDPNIGDDRETNTSFADIDVLKWNTQAQDYTTPLKAQETGDYQGAYNVGMSSASNKNTWVRMDIRSHIQNIGGKDMWYAVYKILADVYVGDELMSEGVDLPLGSEMNRYEVGKSNDATDGGNNSIAIRRTREMAINMPDPSITALENVKLVYRVYYKYYYSFVIDYAASYASYYGSEPQYGLNETDDDGIFEVDNGRVKSISGNLISGDELGTIKLKPVELIASDGSVVNFNYSSFAILEETDGSYHTTGYTVTRTDERGIATTENISGDSVRLVSKTTPAGRYFYAISGVSVSNKNTEGNKAIGDYVLMFQRTALREQDGTEVVASMTGTQVQFASDEKPYSFYGFALALSDASLPYTDSVYVPQFSDGNKVNSVIVNGTEYSVTVIPDAGEGEPFVKLYDVEGKYAGYMLKNEYDHFTLNPENPETYTLSQLMVYDGEGHEVGALGNTLTIKDTVYVKSSADPYYTVEKAFINVSKAANFVKYYDGTNYYVGDTASDASWNANWNANEYAVYYGNQWVTGNSIGAKPNVAGVELSAVEVAAYYVGSDDEPQANVSREGDVTYLKMFLPATSNYRFANTDTVHTVRNGILVTDGDQIGSAGLNGTLYRTADAGEIIGHDAPVTAGVKVSTAANWSSIMLPDTSYGHAKPNRIEGAPTATSSISTILARPVAAKSEVQNNDTINVTFNGAAQGGSAIRIIEDATTIADAYGTLPGEIVVFTISSENETSPILAGTYNFRVTPNKDAIAIANVETGFGAANFDSIPENYYVDAFGGGTNVNFDLIIGTLENSFALNRVVKADGSGYELRITISNLKQSIGTNDGLDFLNLATTDDSGIAANRYLTDTEFGTVKTMIAAGGKFEGENALGVGDNLKAAEEYYKLIEAGTELITDAENDSALSDNQKTLKALYEKLSQVLEYRFQCALGKIFKSANNGSGTFYNNMPDFREGRFSDWKFDEKTGTFTLVFKGNVNLDTDFFSDRYSMRVSGFADIVEDRNRPADEIAYSTNSWMSASSLADGQIERYEYEKAGTYGDVTYVSTQQELKDWLSMTDTTENGYLTAVLTDNIFDFNWGYANGFGGAQVGLDAGRTLNGNGYAIGIVGAEFNNTGNLNLRLTTMTSDHYTVSAVPTKYWNAGGTFLQYVNGIIKNTNFVYRSTRQYDIGTMNTTSQAGLAVGIISGFAGNSAKFQNVTLNVKGQFHVDYIGGDLLTGAFIGYGGFAGYADNIAAFKDCTINYYYVPNKVLNNGYTLNMYEVSATIGAGDNNYHLAWGGFAGITGSDGTGSDKKAERLTVTTQVDAEYANDAANNVSIFVGRKNNPSTWINAGGMFGFTKRNRVNSSSTSTLLPGEIDGIINKFQGKFYGRTGTSSNEIYLGSIAGEIGSDTSFSNVYSYGDTVVDGKYYRRSNDTTPNLAYSKDNLPHIGSDVNSSGKVNTTNRIAGSVIHSQSLSIYQGDEGLVDYYFGGNRYDYYDENGVKYFYGTTKFINGNKVVYSPFDDYTKIGTGADGAYTGEWTGWKLSELTSDGYKIYRDYERNTEIGFIKINADNKSGTFTLTTTDGEETTTSEYKFDENGVLNKAGDTVIGMTVDVSMMTISDTNNTYYFSVPVSRTEADSPRRNDGINIEVLAPAQSFVWEYHTTFYANNLGKTSAVSRVVWNLDQVGGRFNNNYVENDNGFVITGKNEDTPYNHITNVNWYTPALGQFQTMSSNSDGTIFQFVYDGQNHNNNISVTVNINGSKQTITADPKVDMTDVGVYVVGTFDLGADTTYAGSSGYVFIISDNERKGQSRNVTSPQLMVVIYPRVLKIVGGVAKEYDGTTVYEHAIEDELSITVDEEGNSDETVVSDNLVNVAEAGSYEGILTKDKNGKVIVVGDFDDKNASEERAIGFEKQSKRKVLYYTDANEGNAKLLLTVKRDQARNPIIGENDYPELTTVLYGFGTNNNRLDTDDAIPFNDPDSVVAFYAAIGQIDSYDEVRKAFEKAAKEAGKNDVSDDDITKAICTAYEAFTGAKEIATTEIYNFEARVGGKNSSGEAGDDADEYYIHSTTKAVINKKAYGELSTDEAAEYHFVSAYIYVAAELSGDRGFNYALAADGVKVPINAGAPFTTGITVGSDGITLADYNKEAIGNDYVKITPRAIDVWFNGLFQSFYNDEDDAGYNYRDHLNGVTVVSLTDESGEALDTDALFADGATDEEKATAAEAIRRVFPDLPSVLTADEVIDFYKEVEALTVEFNISGTQDAAIRAAFVEQNAEKGQEVKQFALDVNIGGDNFTVNDSGASQVKNPKNPVLTVGHYNGKIGEDGLPYVGDGASEDNLEQYLSITDRRGVLNLNYEYFDYSGFNFFVEKDIDMNGAAIYGIRWSTSNPATFDGGNHAITNFTVARNATDGDSEGITIGFFLTVSENSVVKNLIIADAEIAVYGQSKYLEELTPTRVGGIAGSNDGLIDNVVFEGTIKRFSDSGDTQTSQATLGKGYLGGIVGSNRPTGTIRKAFALVNIETVAATVDVKIGGLVGVNGGVIEDCYVVGKAGMIHGGGCTVGSVVGENGVDENGDDLPIVNVLDMSTKAGAYGATVEIDGETKTTAELKFAALTVKEIVEKYSLKEEIYGSSETASAAPYGSKENPVQIHNFRQLEMALNMPYYFYEITENIVFNTGFDEEKLDKVMGSGYGYGRIKLAGDKRIVLRFNEANEEVAIVAGATAVTATDAFMSSAYGSQVTQYGKPFYELALSFFALNFETEAAD